MYHCPKISGGRSPPVTTTEEWETLTREVDLITQAPSSLPWMWLSATEGDKNNKLARQGHWNSTELVNSEALELQAVETIWRDFYTGQRISNWTKPYYLFIQKDSRMGDGYNCMIALTNKRWESSWLEWQCKYYDQSCPCTYPTQPSLRLRGLCRSSLITNQHLSLKQLPENPGNMIIVGQYTTRIGYNDKTGQWVLNDTKSEVTASSRATKLSYLLGKHEWTISNDDHKCGEGKPYTTILKLTGCAEDEFTCDNGQCIKMERRCDQVTKDSKELNCRDRSDEKGCKLLFLKDGEGYNKRIPPIDSDVGFANVSISITLMKVVEIEERDHSIHLQFQISLSWKENHDESMIRRKQ